jgi:hypothetical protein
MDLSKGSQRREELAGIYESDAFINELAASNREIKASSLSSIPN